jgi:nucleotide-binding universal stress UspA family protein
MKNILVPTDFSECAQHASKAAMLMAAKFKADIHFLHIMPDSDESPHVPQSAVRPKTQDARRGHAQNELNVLVASAARLGVSATASVVLDKGNERIENYIKPLNIDLLVMGSHGATGVRELVMGSNTQRVVRHSSVPVFVVKGPISNGFKITNIVFASTFHENIADAFNVAIGFARLWKATLHVLFVNSLDKVVDKNTINSLVDKLAKPYPDIVCTSNSAESNDEEFGIHQFVEMIGADMIAISTYDKTGFLVRHSVAEDLVNHEAIPVLVISGSR